MFVNISFYVSMIFLNLRGFFCLKFKSEVASVTDGSISKLERQFHNKLLKVQTDGGAEFQILKSYLHCVGIVHPHTEQNENVERKIRHPIDCISLCIRYLIQCYRRFIKVEGNSLYIIRSKFGVEILGRQSRLLQIHTVQAFGRISLLVGRHCPSFKVRGLLGRECNFGMN